jgi:hypothetical protein
MVYLTSLPRKFMRKMAGFFLSRAEVEPPGADVAGVAGGRLFNNNA